MATREEVLNALRVADAAGRKADARALAALYDRSFAATPPTPAPEAPAKKEGFFGAANRAFREQAGTLSAADEAAVYAAKKDAASRKALLEAAKSDKPEGKQGLGAYVGELLGGSAGFMAAPLAAATGTAMTGVGAPAAPFVGAGVGVSQYATQNMVRQAEEEERAAAEGRATQGPSGLRAVAAAVPQAALDVVGGRVFGPLMRAFPFTKNLVMGGPAVKKTEQQLIDALSKGTLRDIGGGVVRGVGKGVAFEVPQEIAQQALERWQANLPLVGAEAAEEYKQAAIGALVLGGGIGGVSGAVERGGQRVEGMRARDKIAAGEEASDGTTTAPGFDGGRDESGVPDLGGGLAGEPAAATTGQAAPIGVGLTGDPAASAGEGEGVGGSTLTDEGLTDEEFDAQQEASQNFNDERFQPGGEQFETPEPNYDRLNSFLTDNKTPLVERTAVARAAITTAKSLPMFEGLDISDANVAQATNILRQGGGNPVAILSDVLERSAIETTDPTASTSNAMRKRTGTPPPAANVVSLFEKRNAAVVENARTILADPRSASYDAVEDAIDALEEVGQRSDPVSQVEADRLVDALMELSRQKRAAAEPANVNAPETPLQRAEREAIEAEDKYVAAAYYDRDEGSLLDRRHKARKAYEAELDRLEADKVAKLKVWDDLRGTDPTAPTSNAMRKRTGTPPPQQTMFGGMDAAPATPPPTPTVASTRAPILTPPPSVEAQGAFDLTGNAAKQTDAALIPIARGAQPRLNLGVVAAEDEAAREEAASRAPSALENQAQRIRSLLDTNEEVAVAEYDRGRATLNDGTAVRIYPERNRKTKEYPEGQLFYYLGDALGENKKPLGETEEEALQNLPDAVREGREAVLDRQRGNELGMGEFQGLAEPVVTDHPDLNRMQRDIDAAGLPYTAGFQRRNNMRNYALFEKSAEGGPPKPIRDATYKTFGGLENAVRTVLKKAPRKSSAPGGARVLTDPNALTDAEGNLVKDDGEVEDFSPSELAWQSIEANINQLYSAGELTGAYHSELAQMVTDRETPSVLRAYIKLYVDATTASKRGVKGSDVKASLDELISQIKADLLYPLRVGRTSTPLPMQGVTETQAKPLPPGVELDLDAAARDAENMVPGGEIVFRKDNYGLIRGYNSANGQPIYVPFVDGVTAIQEVMGPDNTYEQLPLDVSYAKPGVKLSADIISELRAEKIALEKAAAAKHKQAPFVTYDADGVAVSADLDANTAGLIRELKNLLLPNTKVYFTTVEDARANKDNFTGPMRAVSSGVIDDNNLGSSNKVAKGEYYVIFNPTDIATTVELLAHEIGHIHMSEAFFNAPPAIQSALINAHRRWLDKQKGKTAQEFINSLRAFSTAKATDVKNPKASMETLDAYWRSFDEWYADQVSRWATTSEKPLNIVDKFFANVAAALRKFFDVLRSNGFLPDETFKKYLDLSVEGKGFGDMIGPSPMSAPVQIALDVGRPDAPVKGPAQGEVLRGKVYSPQGTLGSSIPLPDRPDPPTKKGGPKAMRVSAGTAEKAEDKQTTVDEAALNVMGSHTASDLNSSVAKMVLETRSLDDALMLIANMSDNVRLKLSNLLMGGMTTTQITTWLKEKTSISNDTIDAIMTPIENMFKRRNVGLRELVDQATFWGEFNKKFPKGAALLHDLMHFSTLLGVDPTRYASASEAITNDERLTRFRKTPANYKTQIEERVKAIRTIYDGGTFKDASGTEYRFAGWNGLSKFGDTKGGLSEGQRIYKMAKDSYDNSLKDHIALLTREIERSSGSDEDKAKRVQQITAQYEEAHKLGVYFPLFRSGMHWMKVGKIFYMFDNGTAQRAAIAKEKAKGNVDIEFGDDVTKFRKEIENASEMLKSIYKLIDEGGLADKETLKDQAWQMYLMTLPEADIRSRFMHRKGTEGFSSDALRAFVSHQHTAINQLSRLEYASEIRTALSAAYDALKGNPDKEQATVLLDEIGKRIETQLNPTRTAPGQVDWDKCATIGNKVVFYWMLTSPKSALVQLTQLPIVGFPVLAARYGLPAVTKTAANYLNVFNKVASSTREVSGAASGDVVTNWDEITMKDSSYVQGMKDTKRKEALEFVWDYMNDRGEFSSTYASDVSGRRNQPTAEYAGKLATGTRAAFNFLTSAFHQAENLSRQIMAMSAGELEYDRLIKEGKSHEAAMQGAAKEAQRLTQEAMFNYSEFDKPRLFKSGFMRLGTQFMSYPLHITAFLFRNFAVMRNKLSDPKDRREATVKFLGTMGMTWMFAGTVGMPGYSMLAGLMNMLSELIPGDDDDDDDDSGSLDKRDFNLWFREVFIPGHFGPDGSISGALGLSPEQAELMARAVKMGPISAFTGLNVGAATSLDQLWFRDAAPAENNKAALMQLAFNTALGPFGSWLLQGAGALDDFEQGRGDRAIEKLAPALIRGAFTASRLEREGALTPSMIEIKEAEYFTVGKLIGQALGFGDTEVADIQKSSILAKRMVTQIKDDRNKLLMLLDRAQVKYANDPSDRNGGRIDALMDDIIKYNEKNYFLPITGETLSDSLSGRAKTRAEALHGLTVDRRLAPLVYSILE